MSLKVGIVGLPNVGKTTLYNAMTGLDMPVSNFPFTTIEPTVGAVSVPDERLDKLVKMYNPKKVVPASMEFVDIPGLGAGASKGEGLGNGFLVAVRESDALVHVVRCFKDEEVPLDGPLDPLKDIDSLNLELIFSDIDMIEKRIEKIQKKAQMKVDKESVIEYELLTKCHDFLVDMKPLRDLGLTKDEIKMLSSYAFLTLKPVLYVLNIDEAEIGKEDSDVVKKIKEKAKSEGALAISISCKIEYEISRLEDEDKEMFLEELGLEKPGLNAVVKAAYDLLGLYTMFTCGDKDCHAWTFKKGMKAPQAAGCIHTDFEKGFIKAEIVSYEDLINAGSEKAAKEQNKFRLEGKEYLVNDGDVVHFRFNL